MTFSIEPAGKNELKNEADAAERLLLHTLDALAERRRSLGITLIRLRGALASGAFAMSAVLALGAAGLMRRHATRVRRRGPAISGTGALFLLGASAALLSLALRARPDASTG